MEARGALGLEAWCDGARQAGYSPIRADFT